MVLQNKSHVWSRLGETTARFIFALGLLNIALAGAFSAKAETPPQTDVIIAILEGSIGNEDRIDLALREHLIDLPSSAIVKLLKALDGTQQSILINNLGDLLTGIPARVVAEVSFGLSEELFEIMINQGLSSLYYPVGTEGVMQFQEDLGDEADGQLTFGQQVELHRRVNRASETEVLVYDGYYLSGQPEISTGMGQVMARGTWIADTIDLVYPINSSTVLCEKDRGLCVVAMANLAVPAVDSDEYSYTLTSGLEIWPVSSWGEREVTAIRRFHCRVATLTINLGSKEVVEVHRNDWGDGCDQDRRAAMLPQPVVNRLVGGARATDSFWRSRKQTTAGYFNQRLKQVSEGRLDGSSRQE